MVYTDTVTLPVSYTTTTYKCFCISTIAPANASGNAFAYALNESQFVYHTANGQQYAGSYFTIGY